MKEFNTPIGGLAVGRFDRFEASRMNYSVSIQNHSVTGDVAGEESAAQKIDEYRLAANVILAMSKARLQ